MNAINVDRIQLFYVARIYLDHGDTLRTGNCYTEDLSYKQYPGSIYFQIMMN